MRQAARLVEERQHPESEVRLLKQRMGLGTDQASTSDGNESSGTLYGNNSSRRSLTRHLA